ncbi:hypothetical protein [Pontibacter brevis]
MLPEVAKASADKVAVIVVELSTMAVTEIPPKVTVAPETKFSPVIVTGVAGSPADKQPLTAVITGRGLFTVKVLLVAAVNVPLEAINV